MVSVKSLLNLSEAFKGLKAAWEESEHPREEVVNGIINRERKELGKRKVGVASSVPSGQELAGTNPAGTPSPEPVGAQVESNESKATGVIPLTSLKMALDRVRIALEA